MDSAPFTYQPRCDTPGCGKPAIYKVAAEWSYGNVSELKNYGMACEACLPQRLADARKKRQAVRPAEGEKLGDVAAYRLMPGVHDRDLPRVPDQPS
jgi:hypothetical protein